MATVLNQWVGYLDRSYEQVKASVLSRVATSAPEITDFSEGNILVVIVSMFSGITEMLNYYIDNMAREAFIETARLFSSMVNLVKLIDYRIKSAIPASADLTFYVLDAPGGTAFPVTSDWSAPAGIIVNTSNGIPFKTTEELIILTGASTATVSAQQVQTASGSIGTTDGTANQSLEITFGYAEGTMNLTINAESWELVDTFAFSNPTSKHFIIDAKTDGKYYIIFGDGTYGAIPPSPYTVTYTCEITEGADGNGYEIGAISSLITSLTLPTGSGAIEVSNPIASSNGADAQGIEEIRTKAPLSVRTNYRAVTYQDWLDIASLADGVKYADIDYCCGTKVKLYIAPVGGGLPTSTLLDLTYEYMLCRKLIGVNLSMAKAGTTNIYVEATIYGKFRYTAAQVATAAIAELVDRYQYNNSGINKKIRLSDITAAIDNLTEVDYVDELIIYAVPYARPFNHETELNWTRAILPENLVRTAYRLEYDGVNMRVSKNGSFLTTWPLGLEYNNYEIKFTINPGVYSIGMKWDFIAYPYNKNIELDDFTVPIITEADLNITTYSQNKSFTCKQDC